MLDRRLSEIMTDAVSRGCFRRLDVLGWTRRDIAAQADAIADAVIAAGLELLPAALDDARQAIEAGMADAAAQTFAASMALAGIAAADRHHAATRPEAVPA
jgi:hypothetical protein